MTMMMMLAGDCARCCGCVQTAIPRKMVRDNNNNNNTNINHNHNHNNAVPWEKTVMSSLRILLVCCFAQQQRVYGFSSSIMDTTFCVRPNAAPSFCFASSSPFTTFHRQLGMTLLDDTDDKVETYTATPVEAEKEKEGVDGNGEMDETTRTTATTTATTTTTSSSSIINDNNIITPAFRRIRTFCVKGVTRRSGPLNEAVAQLLNSTSLEEAIELIAIGAVWARMDVVTEQELLSLYDDDADMASSSRALYADLQGIGSGASSSADFSYNNNGDNDDDQEMDDDLDQYIEQVNSLRFRRVLSPSWIEAATDIRVYPNPRRFPACNEITQDNLLYEDTTFLVVDKPPMLPTQPDSSNYYECCPGCVQDQLGPFTDIQGRPVSRPLLCHRVDSCVGGCVVMSKDRNGQKVFHEMQRDRKLRKLYLAVTTQPVPLGMHLHWMWAPQSARGKFGGPPCQLVSFAPPESRRKARELWHRCLLEVVKCEPIVINAQQDGHNYNPQPSNQVHYQSTIRLVTGRKHQVRAQLAALGCPIIRDTLYEPLSGLTLDRLGAVAQDDNNNDQEDLLDLAMAQARVPLEPIGLQAHAILFGGIRARARTPWWGEGRMIES